jgi:hypothetical protein
MVRRDLPTDAVPAGRAISSIGRGDLRPRVVAACQCFAILSQQPAGAEARPRRVGQPILGGQNQNAAQRRVTGAIRRAGKGLTVFGPMITTAVQLAKICSQNSAALTRLQQQVGTLKSPYREQRPGMSPLQCGSLYRSSANGVMEGADNAT